MEQSYIVLPQRNNNPFNKDYIFKRATTLLSKEKATKLAESLAKQYHGISFHVLNVTATFIAKMEIS